MTWALLFAGASIIVTPVENRRNSALARGGAPTRSISGMAIREISVIRG